jgi:hypothetical protein
LRSPGIAACADIVFHEDERIGRCYLMTPARTNWLRVSLGIAALE